VEINGSPDQSQVDTTPPDPVSLPLEEEETTGPRRVRCEVCGKRLSRMTVNHLRGHGLTRERYRRIYEALPDPTVGSVVQRISGSPDQSPRSRPLTTVDKLARRISSSAAFLDTLAAEVSDHILHAAPLRRQVALAAAQVIQARMAIHADAVGRLSAISDELGQPWRVDQGGSNGGPTPTKDLVAMAMQAHAEIVKAEEMVLKSAKLALEEQKAQDSAKAPTFTFSGAAENIAIPKDLSPADREGLRALMGNLTKYVDASRKARDAITVEAKALPAPSTDTDAPADGADALATDSPTTEAPDLGVTTTAPTSTRRRRTSRRPKTDPVIRSPSDPVIRSEGGVSDLDGGGGAGGTPARRTPDA